MLLSGCAKESNKEREEYIRVYKTADCCVPLERDWVSVEGGSVTYYIKSNVPFNAKWQNGGAAWMQADEPKSLGENTYSIRLTAEPVSARKEDLDASTGIYSKRSGVLMLNSPGRFLGKYLVVDQGFDNRVISDFSWLYGTEDPNSSARDIPYFRWTPAQKGRGFHTADTIRVFSKAGYVRLGDENAGKTEFISPRVSAAFPDDSLLVVSFKAKVKSGEDIPDYTGGTEPILPMSLHLPGKRDAAAKPKLSVEVLGGGVIRDFESDGGTVITFDDIPTYDRESAGFPDNMFDGGEYIVFISGTESNMISVNTSIRLVAEGASIFLDDLCIYHASPTLDEDLFKTGKTSGKDKIIGGNSHE